MGLQSPPGAQSNADGAVSMTDIQRVWKTYIKGGVELAPSGSLSSLSSDGDSTSGYIPSVLFTPVDNDLDLESEDGARSENGMNARSNEIQNFQEFENECRAVSSHLGVDSETESVVSDYSEMADPVKEHLANVQIVHCPNLDPTSPTQFIVREKVLRGLGEGEEAFVRRLRKTNFLSLAQEFADLKRQNENALPFNLHEERYRERQESESGMEETEGISVDSHSRDEPEAGYDSGWQDEALDNGNCVGAETRNSYEFPALVEAESLLALKPSKVVDFDEVLCRRAEETYTEDAVLTSNGTEKCTQSSCAENIPDIVSDQPSIVPHGRSNSLDLSSFYISEPEMIFDRRDCSSTVDSLQKLKMMDDLDDCAIEKVFPHWDWKGLDDELMRACEAELEKSLQPDESRGDREEILQRLAMLDEEDWYSRENELNHVANPLSLGLCYVNEAADDPDPDNWGSFDSSRPDIVPFDHSFHLKADESNDHSSADDLLAKQAALEAEAMVALAQVRPIAQLLSKSENQTQDKLVTEMVRASSSEEKISRHISQQTLGRMTVAQLQIFANDLRAQIEVLNLELMLGLVERDDLHMVQDSMLVDIEDLTGRAREYAAKVDSRRHEKSQVQKCA